MKYISRLLFLLTFAIFIASCAHHQAGRSGLQKFADVTTEEAFTLLQQNEKNTNFVIVDVRTPREYNQEHIAKAININFRAPNFKDEFGKLSRDKIYFIYCRSGHRSGIAMPVLKELNFKTVYNLLGGINGWKEKGYPVVK